MLLKEGAALATKCSKEANCGEHCVFKCFKHFGYRETNNEKLINAANKHGNSIMNT